MEEFLPVTSQSPNPPEEIMEAEKRNVAVRCADERTKRSESSGNHCEVGNQTTKAIFLHKESENSQKKSFKKSVTP